MTAIDTGGRSLRPEAAGQLDRLDVREIMDCACQRLRRTTRRTTQLYDQMLSPAGITITQFGVLAHLHGATLAGHAGLRLGALAERLGMDPTTLNRGLKPLQAHGLVSDRVDPADRRARRLTITEAGRARLGEALPLWRQAEARFKESLGNEATLALNGLLALATAKLES